MDPGNALLTLLLSLSRGGSVGAIQSAQHQYQRRAAAGAG
jgi:hypothetical protein